MLDYNPKNSFHLRFRDMKQHEGQEALKTVSNVVISGRKVSKKEFVEMMSKS